ncbi:MAG: transposase [Thermodesulfovibrio sp.]|nr:transposase [Thermodesulfovibrio sp.]
MKYANVADIEKVLQSVTAGRKLSFTALDIKKWAKESISNVYESGKFKGKSRLSKRENRHLRRVIWLMSVYVIRHNEYFREYFNHKRAHGLAYKKAVLAVAHKLLRTIYAMLKNKTTFNPIHNLSSCM